MFSTEEFVAWAKSGKAVLFAAVMTKIEGREHDALLRTYGFRGFPSLAILDGDGEMVTSSIDRSLASMAARADAAMGYVALKKAAAEGTADPAEWFLARLRMGAMDFETAAEEREGISFTAAQSKEVANAVFDLEIAALRQDAFGRGGTPEAREAAEARIYEGFGQGLRLDESSRNHSMYVDIVARHAEEKGDASAFLEVFPAAVKNVEKNIAMAEQQLERLQEALAKGVADNMKERYEQSIESMKSRIEAERQRIVDLRASAAEMKAKAGAGIPRKG